MRAGLSQGGLISHALFSLYVNDMPSPSQQVELALYADETAIIPTSPKPPLLVSSLESYLNELQRWLSEWRIAINVSRSATIIFPCSGRRFIQPRPVTLFGEPIQRVETTRYLGWPYIDDSPGRLTSTRSGRWLLKGWVSGSSPEKGRVISPSAKESCSIRC